MKKIVSFMLALLLIMSVTMTDTYAMNNNYKHKSLKIAKKGYLSIGITKQFKDIDDYDWAEKAIERMAIKGVIKGYGEGTYQPKRSVTKLEAIIMALRVMGYEDMARINLDRIKKGAKKLKNKGKIEVWAYGYVDVALEKGILDEFELIDMNLNEPAKRHEVAKYIIRALGYEEEAEEYMNKELRFIDAEAVQLGSVGYVYLADKKGIIKGYPDKTYRPNKSITRAEMAVLIARLDDSVYSDIDENEKFAELVAIRENKLILKIDDRNKEYRILENAPVYTKDGKYVSTRELEVGMEIKIQLNDEGIIVFFEIKGDYNKDTVKEYTGEVEDIDNDYEWIELEIGNRDRKYYVIDETKVVFDHGVEGDIEDVKVGDKVYVKIREDDEIVYIEVDRELYHEYKGEVEDIDGDYDWIEIDIGSKDKRFDITDETKVIFEDDIEGDIEDIKIGDEVEVKINEDEEIEYMEVDRELDYDVYEGLLLEVDDEEISILSSKKVISFELEKHVKVEFKDREGDLDDLMVGDEVKLIVDEDDDEVLEIQVDRKYNAVGIAGKLIIVYEDERQIAIKQDTKVKIYDYKSSTNVYVNDDRAKLSDLEEDDNILLIVDDGEVEEIRAYRVE
ncbi:MAG: S-layer homology domain-containing protein [Maledivibacter sp.]|jgi:hypothetical protein|nr:S-layer homology domain-containing protein [Maledivibacter sp.]